MLTGQMSPWHTASGKDDPWKLLLMFGPNWFSNSWDIANMDKCCLVKCCLDKCHCIWWHPFKMVPEVSKSLYSLKKYLKLTQIENLNYSGWVGGWIKWKYRPSQPQFELNWVELRLSLTKKTKNRTFKADFGITLNKAEIVKTLDYTLFRSASSCRNRTCEKKGNKLGLSWAKLSSSWD